MEPEVLAATRARDLGRARVRRLTWWAAVAATAVTGIGAGIAAATIPGHTVAQAQSAAPPASGTDGSGSGSTFGGGSDPTLGGGDPSSGGFSAPAPAPQPGGRFGGSRIVSGGS